MLSLRSYTDVVIGSHYLVSSEFSLHCEEWRPESRHSHLVLPPTQGKGGHPSSAVCPEFAAPPHARAAPPRQFFPFPRFLFFLLPFPPAAAFGVSPAAGDAPPVPSPPSASSPLSSSSAPSPAVVAAGSSSAGSAPLVPGPLSSAGLSSAGLSAAAEAALSPAPAAAGPAASPAAAAPPRPAAGVSASCSRI